MTALEPSQFLAAKLDSFMHLFSFIKEATEEDLKTLPVFGFRLKPNTTGNIHSTIGFTLNSFPYFMLTRIFPYLHYYHNDKQLVLAVVYFDYVINYVIDTAQMQLACPVNMQDLQSCKEEIKKVPQIINLQDSLVEICMNQPAFPKEHMKEYL